MLGNTWKTVALSAHALLLVALFAPPTLAQEAFAELESESSVQSTQSEQPQEVAPPAPTFEQQINNLRSPDVQTRVSAVRALGNSGNQQAITPLVQMLRNDPSPEVRGWTIRALDRFNTPTAQSAIRLAAREDTDQRVRELAVQVCPACAPPPPSAQANTAPSTLDYEGMYPRRRERERDPGFKYRISGWVLFGSSYGGLFLVTIMLSPIEIDVMWPGFVPIVGPALAGTRLLIDASRWGSVHGMELFAGLIGWIGSIVQTTGLILASIGHVRKARHEDGRSGQGRRSNFSFAVVPAGPTGEAGLTFAGTF